jgi:hypothetical protein
MVTYDRASIPIHSLPVSHLPNMFRTAMISARLQATHHQTEFTITIADMDYQAISMARLLRGWFAVITASDYYLSYDR